MRERERERSHMKEALELMLRMVLYRIDLSRRLFTTKWTFTTCNTFLKQSIGNFTSLQVWNSIYCHPMSLHAWSKRICAFLYSNSEPDSPLAITVLDTSLDLPFPVEGQVEVVDAGMEQRLPSFTYSSSWRRVATCVCVCQHTQVMHSHIEPVQHRLLGQTLLHFP